MQLHFYAMEIAHYYIKVTKGHIMYFFLFFQNKEDFIVLPPKNMVILNVRQLCLSLMKMFEKGCRRLWIYSNI